MKKIDKKALLEAVKELLRTAVLGLISYLLTGQVLQSILTSMFGTKLGPVEIATVTGLVTSALKGLDKWLHEKEIETPLDLKGMDKMVK